MSLMRRFIVTSSCFSLLSGGWFGKAAGSDNMPGKTFSEHLGTEEIIEEGKKDPKGVISLDLKNIEIGELFKILAVKSGYMIIPSKEVAGRMSIFLNNISFEEALDVILLTQNLAFEKTGDIITVMSALEYETLYGRKFNERRKSVTFKLQYAKPDNVSKVLNEIKSGIGKVIVDVDSGTFLLIDTPERLALMDKTIKELDAPLETVVFDLDYAASVNLKEYLTNFVTPNVGTVVMDERTNKIVVSDLSDRIKTIKRLVSSFDEGSRQVAIAARIIEITLSDRLQRGIDWGRVKNFGLRGNFSTSLTNYGRVNIGSLSEDDYYGILDFLKTQGDARILSQPQIVVLNNEEAKILIGTREAYVNQTQSQAETTTVKSEAIEFIEVGVKLTVTPTINKEGFVTMKIKPEVSSVKATLTTELESTIPIVETSEAATVVKIKSGSTVMVAGLVKDRDVENVNGIQGLFKHPIFGGLFGNKDRYKQRVEFVVFLTPNIIENAEMEVRTVASINNLPAGIGGAGDFSQEGKDTQGSERLKIEETKAQRRERFSVPVWDKLKGVKSN